MGINCANARSNEDESDKSLAGLDFEGYGRADSVIVDGLKVSHNRTVEMDKLGEILAEIL